MDPDKKPLSSSANEPSDTTAPASGEVDEAQAAAILSAAAASKSEMPAAAPSPAPASAPDASVASPEPPAPAAPSSPTAPSPGASFSSPVPDTPTPSMGDSSSVLGASPASPAGMVTPKKGKKAMTIALVVVVLLIIVFGGVAAALYQVMNKPQNVLDRALANGFSSKATSADFEGSVDIKPKGSTTYATTFTGSEDQKTGAFSLSAKLDALVATIGLDVRSTDGTTMYLRVSGLSSVASLLGLGGSSGSAASDQLAFIAPIIAGLNNQWVQINPSMIKQITGSDANFNAKLSDSDRQKLIDAYKKHQFLTVSKTFKDETIKGKDSKHYQVTVQHTELKNFIAAVKAANIPAFKMTSDNVTAFNKAVDGVDFSKYPLDVWIGKSDKLMDQIAFTASNDGSSVGLRLTVDDYNKPVHVEAPAGAKSLLDVLSQLLTSSAGSSAANALSGSNGISL